MKFFSKIMLFRILISIIFVFIQHTQGCEIAAFKKGSVLACSYKGVEIPRDVIDDAEIQTGTECDVIVGQTIINARCVGSEWESRSGTESSLVHVRQKRSAGLIIFGIVVAFILLFTRAGPPPDRTPPTITCKPSVAWGAPRPYKIHAKVTWKQPTAYDDRDGSIRPNEKSWRSSGDYFPEGDTQVVYEAKDRAGNRNTCTVTVRVKVVRCVSPRTVTNGFFQCSPVTDHLYGSSCNYGCYEGFELKGGPSRITCEKNGEWSATQPVCKPFKCPEPKTIEGAHIQCTNNYFFRSICSYHCGRGFDMPPKVGSAIVCDKNKEWRKCGEPKCIDVEPPRFTECPESKIFGTDIGQNSTNVIWDLPKVSDNSNKARVILQQGKNPGIRLTPGTYFQKYRAEDFADNQASNECSFYIIVREIRCPKLYPTPYVQILCPDGYRSGAQCNISCDPGKIRYGANTVECLKAQQTLYGYWNWKNDKQTICKAGGACHDITRPKYGAIECDNWEGGKYCQAQCKNGAEISSVNLKKLYVCNTDGDWVPLPSKIKVCTLVNKKKSKRSLQMEAVCNFGGNCRDKKQQERIASNVIEAMKENTKLKSMALPKNIKCDPRNVKINCKNPTRTRRSNSHENNTSYSMQISMTFALENASDPDSYLDIDYAELKDVVRDVLVENEELIFENTSVNLLDIKNEGLQVVCPRGTVKSEQSWNCIDCPEGTYYTDETGTAECVACRKGSYQDEVAQMNCIRCPVGSTTQSLGAKHVNDCIEACPAGSFSLDGLLPCSPCEQGHYQPSFGQTFCRPCKGSKSTVTFGSSSASDCNEFDIDFLPDELSNVQVELPRSLTVTDFTLSFWYQGNFANTSLSAPILGLIDTNGKVTWALEKLQLRKRENAVDMAVDLIPPDTRWHYIHIYNSKSCDLAATLDGIPLPVYKQSENCGVFSVNKIRITFDEEESGSLSKFNMWHGKKNTAHGQRCFSNNKGDMVHWKKFEEANLTGAYMHFPSQCDDFDNCVSSPCLHGACTDALHGFSCTCDRGYTGTQCDVNIDDCDVNICLNNATCEDGVASYTCLCPDEFTGRYCETLMVDGGWSEWGHWSECSTSCGEGLMNRRRMCNSPTPDNGGLPCLGDQYHSRDCNNSDCPVCPDIMAPANGTIDCTNDTESINCTVSCYQGFDFDIEPLDLYYCGPETFHVWNHHTDENPERRLPECVAIQLPEELKISYTAQYRDLHCSYGGYRQLAMAQIDITLKSLLANVTCLQTNSCNLTRADVTGCAEKERNTRSTEVAGIHVEFASNTTEDDYNDVIFGLQDAFEYINNATESGKLTVHILDRDFEIDTNQTGISGDVVCRPGHTKVKIYCVPCGIGAYLYQDYCESCPIGTYQDQEAQGSCIKCPEGRSTIGIRSTSRDDCTVKLTMPEEEIKVPWFELLIGCGSVLVIGCVVWLCSKRYKFTHGGMQLSKGKEIPFEEQTASSENLMLFSIKPLQEQEPARPIAVQTFDSDPIKADDTAEKSFTTNDAPEKSMMQSERM